jgi:hypothetical protein
MLRRILIELGKLLKNIAKSEIESRLLCTDEVQAMV